VLPACTEANQPFAKRFQFSVIASISFASCFMRSNAIASYEPQKPEQ